MTLRKKFLMFVMSAAVMFLAGCATIDGAGEDIESAGEEIQDASDS